MGIFCRHYGGCGGCDFQEMEYSAQLEYKDTYCRNLFASFGCVSEPVVASPAHRHFRNKMEFAVSAAPGSEGSAGTRSCAVPVIGQRVKERFDRIVDLAECPVCDERVPQLLEEVRGWMRAEGVAPYDFRQGTGELRYVGVKSSRSAACLMVTLVCSLDEAAFPLRRESYRAFARRLTEKAGARSVYVCLNPGRSDVAVSGSLVNLAGEDHIRERVNGVEYVIRPQTFFQTNPGCCEKLYAEVLACAPRLQGHIYDVYCGSGGITLQFAAAGRSVTGIDLSPRNIADAKENAALNGLAAEFICSDADAFIKGLSDSRPWSMVVDPPRNGLNGPFMKILEASGPASLVYVSCSPLKLREDLKKLSASYVLERLVPVDMFPHTRHFEAVALLKRRPPQEAA